ncbi:MAG: hypothetical protein BJ554DRAFT_7358 [Olpidium bornovanus]|uniref:Uncharacterized protein n=1 Tax=Olpidium bornovanus TaxID=278681 RepID=A0A8H7ZWS1_9FUNG|nr:MAG: hypothetical protein BJ554DRAFT_7358 [Olpidium bornovanus]
MATPAAPARAALQSSSVPEESIEALLDYLFCSSRGSGSGALKRPFQPVAKPNPVASANTPTVLNAVCTRGKELLHRPPMNATDAAAARREQHPYLFLGRSILEHSKDMYPSYTLLGSVPSLSDVRKSGRVYLGLDAGTSVLVLGRSFSGKTETLRRFVEGCNLGLHPFGSSRTGDDRVGRLQASGTRTLVISRAAHPSYHGASSSSAVPWHQPADFADLADAGNPERAAADLSVVVLVPPAAYEASLRIYDCESQQPPDGCRTRTVLPLIFDVRDLAPVHFSALMGFDGLRAQSEVLYQHVCQLLRMAMCSEGIGGTRLNRTGWNYRGFRASLRDLIASLTDESQRKLLAASMDFMDCHIVQELEPDGQESEDGIGRPLESVANLLGKGGNCLVVLDLRHPLVTAKTAELLASVVVKLWQNQATDAPASRPAPSVLVLDDLDVYLRDVPLLPLVDPLRSSGRVSTFVSVRDVKKLPGHIIRTSSCIVVHASAMEPTVPTLIQKLHLPRSTSEAILEVAALRPGEAIVCCGNSRLYTHEDDRKVGRLRVCKVILRQTVTGPRAASDGGAQQENAETSKRRGPGGTEPPGGSRK